MTPPEILRTLVFGFPVIKECLDTAWPIFIQSLGGLMLSFFITIGSLIGGAILGMILALMRFTPVEEQAKRFRFRPVVLIGSSVEWFIRGLPIMIIVLLFNYLPFALFKLRVPGAILAVGAFSLYGGAYFSGVFLGGLRCVSSDLRNASRVLGLSSLQTLIHIRIPIAVRTMLPALLGITVTLFKDSSVLVVVAVPELMYTARQMAFSSPSDYAPVLGTTLLLYWIIATMISGLARLLEQHWDGAVSR